MLPSTIREYRGLSETASDYEVLGVNEIATASEIIAAYKRLSPQLHLDKNDDPNNNFTTLSNELETIYAQLMEPFRSELVEEIALTIDISAHPVVIIGKILFQNIEKMTDFDATWPHLSRALDPLQIGSLLPDKPAKMALSPVDVFPLVAKIKLGPRGEAFRNYVAPHQATNPDDSKEFISVPANLKQFFSLVNDASNELDYLSAEVELVVRDIREKIFNNPRLVEILSQSIPFKQQSLPLSDWLYQILTTLLLDNYALIVNYCLTPTTEPSDDIAFIEKLTLIYQAF